jgi:hypothetical protein
MSSNLHGIRVCFHKYALVHAETYTTYYFGQQKGRPAVDRVIWVR